MLKADVVILGLGYVGLPTAALLASKRIFVHGVDTNEKISYKIVGKDEADLKKKLIYFQSPIGKGLIGKNKDDLVEISTPAGTKNFEIKDVKYI